MQELPSACRPGHSNPRETTSGSKPCAAYAQRSSRFAAACQVGSVAAPAAECASPTGYTHTAACPHTCRVTRISRRAPKLLRLLVEELGAELVSAANQVRPACTCTWDAASPFSHPCQPTFTPASGLSAPFDTAFWHTHRVTTHLLLQHTCACGQRKLPTACSMPRPRGPYFYGMPPQPQHARTSVRTRAHPHAHPHAWMLALHGP